MYFRFANGDYWLLRPKKFAPLSYSELLMTHNNETNTYKMTVSGEVIRTRESNRNPPLDNQKIIRLPITFNKSLPIYGLVERGWLPPPFILPANLLLDRNVIGYLEQISKGNTRSIYQEADWWLQLINSPDLVINPFLFAFEGSKQKPPTLDEFKKSFEEASLIIRKQLPNARVIIYDDSLFNDIFKEVSNIIERHQEESEFLIRTVPLIREPAAERDLAIILTEILKIAQDLGLSVKSLVVLSVLSCLYENFRITQFNTARKVLHIEKGGYTLEKAYNALSDLRALSFYLAFLAIAKSKNEAPFAFCSADRAIILFGCGLEFHNVQFVGNSLNVEFNLTPNLFPRLPQSGLKELAQILST